MVELGGCYSNPQAREMIALAEQAIRGIKIDSAPPAPTPTARRWRPVDRLGEQIIRELLEDRRSGVTKKAGRAVWDKHE